MITDIEATIGVACQIAYEYEDWTQEHVSDMYNTYKETGEKPPCSYDELYDATSRAEIFKVKGLNFDEVMIKMRGLYKGKKKNG